jgi:diguanylate cyclase (GGDEF)-like protein
MSTKTILIVDDTITNLDILYELLDGYDIVPSTNGKEVFEIISQIDIDLILLDIMMPEMDGYEVCEKLKRDPNTKNIPIIFITAKTDEDSIEKAYDVGGSDYITKPFKPKELLARVKRELKLQELQNELKLLASTDPMTKLYNRRHFTSISEHTLELAKRSKQEISLIMIDIDKFKNVNDTYGHQVGDEVIIFLANSLLSSQRTSDVICRYGGEEFVILLPNTSKTDALKVAETTRKMIEKSSISLENTQDLKFTISLGVSDVNIENEVNIETALKRADNALYRAKESGRNRVC